jgi:hypothetical protein
MSGLKLASWPWGLQERQSWDPIFSPRSDNLCGKRKAFWGFTVITRTWATLLSQLWGWCEARGCCLSPLAIPLCTPRFPGEGAARFGALGTPRAQIRQQDPSPDPLLCLLLAQVLCSFSSLLPWEPQVVEVCASCPHPEEVGCVSGDTESTDSKLALALPTSLGLALTI